jgi:hypothetical protein
VIGASTASIVSFNSRRRKSVIAITAAQRMQNQGADLFSGSNPLFTSQTPFER